MTTAIRAGIPRIMEAKDWIQQALWYECPWDDIGQPGGVPGAVFEDNGFRDFPTVAVNASNILQKYRTWVDTGGTIVPGSITANAPLGGVVLTLDTTTNDAASIQTGNLVNFIDPGATLTPYDIWFDAQFEIGTLTDSCFVGLMAYQTPATAAIITDSDVIADFGCIGFSTLQATPTILNLTYKKAGQTVQVPVTNVLGSTAMVAGTKVAVGFHYKSINPTARRITPFVNNVRLASGVTKAMMAAATFPGANVLAPTTTIPMALTAAIKNFTTTAGASMILHRWRCAMAKSGV